MGGQSSYSEHRLVIAAGMSLMFTDATYAHIPFMPSYLPEGIF